MFTQQLLGSVNSSDSAVTRHVHVLGKLVQATVLSQRPRLGKAIASSHYNPNLHTCHYISFKEIFNHVYYTIMEPDHPKAGSNDIYKRLTQYFSTILRGGRTPTCSRAIIFIVYLFHTFDKYFIDKKKLPVLKYWVDNRILQKRFYQFWFEIYNHSGNLAKDGHPRTNLTIKSRRDLVYSCGNICSNTHGVKLADKWNSQLRSMGKNDSPEHFNLPLVKQTLIGTKYTCILDHSGKELTPDQVSDMFERGWFFLSSHAATYPRYKLPIGPDAKNFPEVMDAQYFDPRNDNFDLKISHRANEVTLDPDNMTKEDKSEFKHLVKDILARDRESPILGEKYSLYDTNVSPLNNDIEEPMPAPNAEQTFVYCGYVAKGGQGTPVAAGSTSRSGTGQGFFSTLFNRD